ncbi:MAG: hypothetical protein MR904_00145 [Clostridia bacterium]|nr:hypothetical protein [Clostridia bacterium]
MTTTLFFGIVNDVWFSFNIVETSISSCLLAISIYAISQRIVILIKGFISGKITIKDSQVQKTISSLKENIKTLTSNINKDESALKQLSEKILCLLNIKKEIECSTDLIDLNKLSETNTQIQALTNEEIKLEEKIINAKNELNEYKLKLSQENTTKSVS